MNTDQNSGAIKFSIAGLAACAAVFAFAQIPAIHQILSSMLPAFFLIIAVAAWVFTVHKVRQGEDDQTRGGRLVVAAFLLVDAAIAMGFAYGAIYYAFKPGDQIYLQDDLRHYLYACTVFGLLAVAAVSRVIVPGRIFSKHKNDFLFFLRWSALTLFAVFLVVFLQDREFNDGSVRLIYLLTSATNRVIAGDFLNLIMLAFFGMFFVKIVLGLIVSERLGNDNMSEKIRALNSGR